MGLTIQYGLSFEGLSFEEAQAKLEQLRQRALDLPFEEVSVIKVFNSQEEFEKLKDDEDWRWAHTQAHGWSTAENCYERSAPLRGALFMVWPGEGCESANFGACDYLPGFDGDGTGWTSFCKTIYATEVSVEHFLYCHVAVITLLDYAKELGILRKLNDEGGYAKSRDIEKLIKEADCDVTMLAGMKGALAQATEGADHVIEASITQHPSFEHLEAKGVKLPIVKKFLEAITSNA